MKTWKTLPQFIYEKKKFVGTIFCVVCQIHWNQISQGQHLQNWVVKGMHCTLYSKGSVAITGYSEDHYPQESKRAEKGSNALALQPENERKRKGKFTKTFPKDTFPLQTTRIFANDSVSRMRWNKEKRKETHVKLSGAKELHWWHWVKLHPKSANL